MLSPSIGLAVIRCHPGRTVHELETYGAADSNFARNELTRVEA